MFELALPAAQTPRRLIVVFENSTATCFVYDPRFVTVYLCTISRISDLIDKVIAQTWGALTHICKFGYVATVLS